MSSFQTGVVKSSKGKVSRLISLVALVGLGGLANAQPVTDTSVATQAQQLGNSTQAVGLRLGNHGSYKNASIFWQTPVWWQHGFNNGWGRVELMGEATATYWDAKKGSDHSSMWQAGFAPMLRWWPSETPFYLEAGVGPTVVSHTSFGGYGLGTAFQIGSYAGVGYVFDKRHQVSLRVSHFSNASIKQPNDGLNVVQLDYAVRF